VKLIRSPTRIGLIKARMLGAVNAVGSALVFLDGHCEVAPGWLEPLLDRLAINKNITAISQGDVIEHETLEYGYNSNPDKIQITGFCEFLFRSKSYFSSTKSNFQTGT
jgi:glycosyltransferase involved in cell wall biosynthesis